MKMNSFSLRWLLSALLLAISSLYAAAHYGATPEARSHYILRILQSGNVVTNRGVGENDSKVYVEAEKKESNGQVWQFLPVNGAGEGVYTMCNPYTHSAIDFAAQNTHQQFVLQWSPNTMNSNQQMRFEQVEEGQYRIRLQSQSLYLCELPNHWLGKTTSKTQAAIFELKKVEVKDIEETTAKWENPQVFRVNNIQGHAPIVPYASEKEWESDEIRTLREPWRDPQSSMWQTLNGIWKLQWQDRVSPMPAASHYAKTTDDTQWADITVPNCLEMLGYGDPLYINVDYPFHDNPPYIRMKAGLKNSVASLRRHFRISDAWKGKRVILHFDGIYGATEVWLNGHYVGYTQEANNVSEMDVTPYLTDGDNVLALQIVRWSDASYLEGQDMWHMSGVHRDVFLYATPKTYISDYYFTDNTHLDTKQSIWQGKVWIDNPEGKAVNGSLDIVYYDPKGKKFKTDELAVAFAEGEKQKCLRPSLLVEDVKLWSPEQPSLYTIRMTLQIKGEKEVVSLRYGCRKIEYRNGQLWINGARTFLWGTNAQDTHPITGRTVDISTMLKDIQLMKQANMNVLRTSHYPRQTKMMDMLDTYGLFVVDEADLECHKNWGDRGMWGIGSSDDWKAQMYDRVLQMVLRDRNHPSVILWSLGNESSGGRNFDYIYDEIMHLMPDDTRKIHYEGATRDRTKATDIHSVMYPAVSDVQRAANSNDHNRPYFMCEFAHSMGNATGNLPEYISAIEQSRYGMGGCIWDWVNQSIYDVQAIKAKQWTVNGFPNYISGYDKPGPHQGNFVNNGLINADREWSDKLDEVKKDFQKVTFKHRGQQIEIYNGYYVLPLEHFVLHYAILENGKKVEELETSVKGQPQSTVSVALPTFTHVMSPYKEYLLNIELRLKNPTLWAKAGYAVATEQFVLQERSQELPAEQTAATALKVEKTAERWVISKDKMQMTFTRHEGLTQWHDNGLDLLENAGGPRFDDFRWIENDREDYYNVNNGMTQRNWQPTEDKDGKWVKITYTVSGSKAQVNYVYTVYNTGVMRLRVSLTPLRSGLRRLGIAMRMNRTLTDVHYYAAGKRSNYVDRCSAAYLGDYTATTSELLTIYARPQSTGNHLKLRSLKLTDKEGRGMQIETEGTVAFSALPYSDLQLKDVRHYRDLSLSDGTYMHFDYMQEGLGNHSCGPGVLPQYKCPASGTYHFTLRFTPLNSTTDGVEHSVALQNEQTIYNLKGHLLQQPQKGIQIIDGKAVYRP